MYTYPLETTKSTIEAFLKTQKTLSLTYSRNLIMHEYLLIFIINIHINKYYLCKN